MQHIRFVKGRGTCSSGERNVKIWIDFWKSPRFSLTSPLSQLERQVKSTCLYYVVNPGIVLFGSNNLTTLLLLFEIYNRGLKHVGSMAFCKHITNYGPLSGFRYYKLTIPHREGSSYPPPGYMLSSSVVLNMSIGNLHQYLFYKDKRF